MSAISNQVMITWKTVADDLRRRTIDVVPGQGATSAQARVVQDCYLLWLCVWSDVCGQLPATVLGEITRLLTTEAVTTVLDRVEELDGCLIWHIQNAVDPWPGLMESFKQTLGEYPHSGKWYWLVTRTISWCKRNLDDDVSCFKALHQIFVFPGRMNIPGRDELVDEAARSFLKQEEALKYQYAAIGLPLNRIMRRWFPDSIETYERLYGDWVPKHGNGSVAEGPLSISEKYKCLRTDHDLDFLGLLTGGLGYPRLIPAGLNRTAVVQFVPKSAKKLRTICMEPASLQFQQQAGFRALRRYFDKHPYLRRRIDLARPELNREMARIGSIDGSYATIDLSAASDSVSWKLVRSAFDGTPLLPLLHTTRSINERMPDGQILRTRKYAPMGSALCFPVECLIFSAIVEYAINKVGGTPKRSLYRVYGDDIIVERKYALAVITALQDFGFTVNAQKSYYRVTHLSYRESCGGEYILGADVTPVRIPRNFAGLSKEACLSDSCRYEGLIDLANTFYGRYPTARRVVLSCLNSLPKWARPIYVAPGEDGGIMSPQPTNHRNFKRTFVDPQVTPNIPYQRDMVKHGCAKTPQGVVVPEDEDIRLYECLRSMAGSPDRDPMDSAGETFIDHLDRGPAGRRLTSRWT